MALSFDVQAIGASMRRMNLLPQMLRPTAGTSGRVDMSAREGETVHRLQVGLVSLGAMVLMVGVANMIMDRAREAESAVVPEAAPTVQASPLPDANKALENAGVVPDLPKDAAAEPVPQGPVLPEQGDGLANPAE